MSTSDVLESRSHFDRSSPEPIPKFVAIEIPDFCWILWEEFQKHPFCLPRIVSSAFVLPWAMECEGNPSVTGYFMEKSCLLKSRATCWPKSRCQSDLSTVSVLANGSLHQDLMHSRCRGTAAPNVCLQAFSLFPLPSSPLDQRPVHRLLNLQQPGPRGVVSSSKQVVRIKAEWSEKMLGLN